METVAVTLTSPYLQTKEAKDLLLPLNTPQYILVNALAEALNIKIEENTLRGVLSTHRNGKKEIFPLEKTLRDVGIKFGDLLVLDFQEISAQATLICVDGPEFDLTSDEVMIGCDPKADIDLRSVPKQEFISGTHAKITFDSKNYYLEDFESKNGTYLNEIPVGGKVLLEDGDTFRLGASDAQGIRMSLKIQKNNPME
jgi:uncharacterized ubiquitin-like protein YukD